MTQRPQSFAFILFTPCMVGLSDVILYMALCSHHEAFSLYCPGSDLTVVLEDRLCTCLYKQFPSLVIWVFYMFFNLLVCILLSTPQQFACSAF